jgi:nucleoid DNA-binding protein
MTKAELIEEVSRVVEMTRKDSEVIVEAIFDSVVRSLRSGDKIEIRGFGSFRTRQRQPRVGPESEDRRARGSAGQAHPVFQAQQGTEGPGQQRLRWDGFSGGRAFLRPPNGTEMSLAPGKRGSINLDVRRSIGQRLIRVHSRSFAAHSALSRERIIR